MRWPTASLDGELWLGRGQFQQLLSIVKKQKPVDSDWKQIHFMVFDMPDLNEPFKQRIETLTQLITQSKGVNPYISAVRHKICESILHLKNELEKVEKNGGEGVMLRDPNSLYERRRSKTLLKVKSYIDDEAQIIAYEKGQGACRDVIGSFKVRSKDGKEFFIGSGLDQNIRANPPPIGSIITFKYYGLTNDKKPRFPIFLRVKDDEV